MNDHNQTDERGKTNANDVDSVRRNMRLKGWFKRVFNLRTRLIILAVMLGVSIAILITPGAPTMLRNSLYSFLPTSPFELTLSGTPTAMGKTQGKARGFAIRLLCDLYLKRMICRGDEKLLRKRETAAAKLFAGIAPRWTDEATGLAETSGVPKEQLMLANSFLDLGFDRCGCRQVVMKVKTADGKTRLLHSHNLDWNNLGGIGNFLVTIFRTKRRPGRLATVHIAFPGMIGALTIINEKGVSLGFNQRGFARIASEMPVFLHLREIAETSANFAEVRGKVLETPRGMPFFIVLADAKSGKAMVFERAFVKITERDLSGSAIAADNASWFGQPPVSCPAEKTACTLLRNSDCDPLSAMKATMRNPVVLLGCNIYSVIFDFSKNTFHLASGQIPAAKGKYRKFTLFPKKD